MSSGFSDTGGHSLPQNERKQTYHHYTTTRNCDHTGRYMEKSRRDLMPEYVDLKGDVYLPWDQVAKVPKEAWPEHLRTEIPIGAQAHVNAYNPKKAKRFVANCEKPHETPRVVAPNYQSIPFIDTVSGSPYALYQVFKSTGTSYLAVTTHHLIPKDLRNVEINEKSWITGYCNRYGHHISAYGRLLLGDLIAVKWAERRQGAPAIACEFQVFRRKGLENEVMGVMVDQQVGGQGQDQIGDQNSNLAVIVGLPYPVKLGSNMASNLGKVYKADIFIPVKSEFGDVKFLDRTPDSQIFSRRVDIKLSNLAKLMMSNNDDQSINASEKDLETLVRLGSAFAQHTVDFGFFQNLPEGSNAKNILKSVFTGSPAPRGPRLTQQLIDQLEESLDFSDFQMDYVQKMLHKVPVVIGTFPDSQTPKNLVYSILARCATCLGNKWNGTHLVVARDYCNARIISKKMGADENLKAVRFTGQIEPKISQNISKSLNWSIHGVPKCQSQILKIF